MLTQLRALLPHKIKATSIHLALSVVIFLVVLYLILFHWYPGPWFALDGGWQGVRIMVFVDLVLGPTLTFLIFNPGKTRLALGIDFSFIAVTQLAALIWGIYAVHHQRPLAIAHWQDRFYSVDTQSLKKQSLDANVLRDYGADLPVLVYAEEPQDPQTAIEMSLKAITQGVAEYEQPQLYRQLGEHLEQVFAKQISLTSLSQAQPGVEQKLSRIAAKHGLKQPEDLCYLRFSGRYKEATLIFTPKGELVGSLPLALEPGANTKPAKTPEASTTAPG